MKIAVLFDNFGPYHLARLRASATISDLFAVEVAASSAEYAWKRLRGNAETLKSEILKADDEFEKAFSVSIFKIVTLLERDTSREASHRELEARLNNSLNDFRPHAVFIPGWSSKAAFMALRWCIRHEVPAVAMSESTEWDEARTLWREAVKQRIISLCSAALVGGTAHKGYMVKLGMSPEQIFFGYDAVDNGYFKENAEKLKAEILKKEVRKKYGLPENYFLASARFIEKKNLPRLLQTYALYRQKAEDRSQKSGDEKSEIGNRKSEIWDLVLLGDGDLRSSILNLRSSLDLGACVHLPGFRQYDELPAYYGLAKVFIHASTTEQWGLVVNEAMSSGLPVLVSNRCGCAQDLVQEGVNGFTFDPHNIEEMSDAMLKISTFEDVRLSAFGDASRAIISQWGPERFAAGLKEAAEKAFEVGPKRAGILNRMLLFALMRR
jgi:glycosyltransferase involved in cell wall biosynthesis